MGIIGVTAVRLVVVLRIHRPNATMVPGCSPDAGENDVKGAAVPRTWISTLASSA